MLGCFEFEQEIGRLVNPVPQKFYKSFHEKVRLNVNIPTNEKNKNGKMGNIYSIAKDQTRKPTGHSENIT